MNRIAALKIFLLGLVLTSTTYTAWGLDISNVPKSDWIQLFNGKDLVNWVPFIQTHKVGEDPEKTFYVKDSILWVDYSNYTGGLLGRMGSLSWEKRKFSYFLVRGVYQFWGTQVAGGPDWGKQNNGILYHSQSMASIVPTEYNGYPPISMECQLLGENNLQNTDGTTANLCSIGSTVIINGKRDNYWCQKAKPHNIIGLPWVTAEVLVYGDSLVKHIVMGDTVMTYTKLLRKVDNQPMKDGYIVIQAESAPTKFKSLEVLDLVGCMDMTSSSYRDYFVKNDPTKCVVTKDWDSNLNPLREALRIDANRISVKALGSHSLTVRDLEGKITLQRKGNGPQAYVLGSMPAGVYFVSLQAQGSIYNRKFVSDN